MKDNYGNPDVPFHYAITEKAQDYFKLDQPSDYIKLTESQEESQNESDSILIEKHRIKIQN